MKKKLSVKAIISLLLSALLFCMPVGAFIANNSNTVDVHAKDADSAKESTKKSKEESAKKTKEKSTKTATKESTKETDNEEENGTISDNDANKPECTCTEKCSQYDFDNTCEVCGEDYTLCGYVNPSVKITIATPSGWHNDTTKVHISVEDVAQSGNFAINTVQAKIGQNGSWTDITEDMYVEISENSTIYVLVTDQNEMTYEKNRYIKCYDFTKPTLNAAVSDGLLSVQAYDTDSGIKAVYVNGYEFTDLTNGVLNIRLQQFDAGYQYFTISAMDNAGNMSEVYKTANPYYTDPENSESDEGNPAEQLPESAEATKPSTATAQVTEHTTTDSDGNTVSGTNTAGKKNKEKKEAGKSSSDSEKGKEFYTIKTASEKVFYLVIDRDGDEENVYFLTEISENDLLNVTSDNSETLPKNSAALESAIPVADGALSNNNVDDMESDESGELEPEEETEESTEETEDEEASEDNPMVTYIIMGILVVAVIGGGYYFKVARKKNGEFLDEDDEENDENEEYEDDEDEETESEDDFFDAEDSEEE